ncbi:hypothetical protein ACUH93_07060 [Dermabacteraceae bacterium P7006]
MDTETLIAYLRADPTERDEVERVGAAAANLIDHKIGAAGGRVPSAIRDQAIQAVAANLWEKRTSNATNAGLNSPDMLPSPRRPALDPLTLAWPILRPYIGGGLA